MKNIVFMIISVVVLFSCKSVPNNNNNNNLLNDTISIKNLNGEIVSGINKSNSLVFSKIGQEYKFNNGDDIQLIIKGIDMNEATFDIITDGITKEITIRLVDKNNSMVVFAHKCQTISRYNIDVLPRVKLNKNLSPEQIIFTPILDDDCSLIGFQMRYGSQERGCTDSTTNEIYRRFMFCADKDSIILKSGSKFKFDDVNTNKNSESTINQTKTKDSKSQNESKKSKLKKMGFPIK